MSLLAEALHQKVDRLAALAEGAEDDTTPPWMWSASACSVGPTTPCAGAAGLSWSADGFLGALKNLLVKIV